MSDLITNNLDLNKDDFKFINGFGFNRFDQVVGKPSTYAKDVFKRFIKNPWTVIFSGVFLLIILLIIFVPILSPFSATDPISKNVFAENLRPRWHGGIINGYYQTAIPKNLYDEMIINNKGFIITKPEDVKIIGNMYYVTINPYALDELQNYYPLFGTDSRGVDIWTKSWVGAGSSLLIAVGVASISVVIGAIYGSISGAFAGRWVDIIMMRIIEILSGVPTILWLLILSVIFSSNKSSTILDNQSLFFSLVAIMWMSPANLTRTYIMKTKDAEYVQAVRTLGGNQFRIIFVHMLPNICGKLLVRFVHIIPVVIFFESTLVFLGLKSPTELGLGTLINDGNAVQEYIAPLLLPALIMILLTLSAQIIANGLNDAVDPRSDSRK